MSFNPIEPTFAWFYWTNLEKTNHYLVATVKTSTEEFRNKAQGYLTKYSKMPSQVRRSKHTTNLFARKSGRKTGQELKFRKGYFCHYKI